MMAHKRDERSSENRQGKTIPDPRAEIRLRGLHAARGINYWSRRPVIRMDVSVGAFDEISSADAPGCTEALLAALPGLEEHECSYGRRGGFVQRLREGTYAPHIIEHVALEVQTLLGHRVGYGKTRGGEQPGEYTLIFEYEHERVGLRAAAMGLEIVQQAFEGRTAPIEATVAELRLLDDTDEAARAQVSVFCGITGGALRSETQHAVHSALLAAGERQLVVVDVAPAYLLRAGLPYERSEMCVILNTDLPSVAPVYRTPINARRLVGTLIEGTRRGGVVVCPAGEHELQALAKESGCRVIAFRESGTRIPAAIATLVTELALEVAH